MIELKKALIIWAASMTCMTVLPAQIHAEDEPVSEEEMVEEIDAEIPSEGDEPLSSEITTNIIGKGTLRIEKVYKEYLDVTFVYVYAEAEEGYHFQWMEVTDSEGEFVRLIDHGPGWVCFLDGGPATVTAIFESDPPEHVYHIITEYGDNGIIHITLGQEKYEYIATAIPYPGYRLAEFFATDPDGNPVGVYQSEDTIEVSTENNDVIVHAEFEGVGMRYTDETGKEYYVDNYKCLSELPDQQGVTMSDGWYVVDQDYEFSNRLTVSGEVNLILCDGMTLNAKAGIRNAESIGSSISIWAQSSDEENMGKLICTGGKYQAGIGGNEDENNGAVRIYGGNVEAFGGTDASGIGGGENGNGGYICLLGGDVKGYGNDNAAGIGGGQSGSGGTIIISGGNVLGQAEDYSAGSFFTAAGAGIGGGEDRDGGTITILGGNVRAIGGTGFNGDGAGIGGGDEGSGGTIIIKDGTIFAKGGDLAAGIGGGYYGNSGSIRIEGGNVEAYGNRGHNEASAAIGSGVDGNVDTIEISGGIVNATAVMDGAAIGSGTKGSAGTITIRGGIINANSWAGACIGTGRRGSGGTVTVKGGELHLKIGNGVSSNGILRLDGGSYGACIGSGGDSGAIDLVEIKGGVIDAVSEYGFTIGGGDSGEVNEIRVSGGDITALTGSSYDAAFGDDSGRVKIVVEENMVLEGGSSGDIASEITKLQKVHLHKK